MCVGRSSCDNGRCIPKRWFCDKMDDCGDWSDEKAVCSEQKYHYMLIVFIHNISLAKPCTDKEYRCPSGRCISITYVCDGDNDCGGWEDEVNCTHRK